MPKRTELNQDLKATYGFKASTLEDIDQAIYSYLQNDLAVSCDLGTTIVVKKI